MDKYIIFGAGKLGHSAVGLIGVDKIEFILDNDVNKKNEEISGLRIYKPTDKYSEIKNKNVIIAVGTKYYDEIENQLRNNGILHIISFQKLSRQIIKARIQHRSDYIAVYKAAINWIKEHTLVEKTGKSIINNTHVQRGYPEVTGYFIPSLIRAGYGDLAMEYARWLCSIQHADGSWWDTDDAESYTFDSAQILKGLLAVREMLPLVDQYILKGCDWLITNIHEDGRMTTADESAVGNKRECSELIHLYCLSPLIEAAKIFNKPEYKEQAEKVLRYYKTNHRDEIVHFNILSHFYSYIVEAMVDLGEYDLAREAMDNVASIQNIDGSVPAYKNVHWVCSTGLFQFATIWFRLDDREHGEKAFRYAMSLQNESGGWYGSYPPDDKYKCEENDYFPISEISWAVKYFLDALYYKNKADFKIFSPQFFDEIDRNDGRYVAVFDEVKKLEEGSNVIDVGCSKGRYLKNLIDDVPDCHYFGVDIATSGMESIKDDRIEKKSGILTCIPYPDNKFDMAYVCEALEHCIDVDASIRELARVVKPGGKILIVDKNAKALGEMEIDEWEQWFSSGELKDIMLKYCSSVTVTEDVPYDPENKQGVFSAWCGMV